MIATLETKCITEGCEHVFKPVISLYGRSAFSKCPKCGAFVPLKIAPEATEAPHGATTKVSAWRKPVDLPDDDITVLIRLKSKDSELTEGCHSGTQWYDSYQLNVTDFVTGWMHLEDAARILDAAVLT